MKILGIIPARYNSSRFPGKPLAEINHKSMIQRVYEQVSKAKCLSDVIVATDDERILNHVMGFGGKALMTSSNHKSGTERCWDVYQQISEKNNFDIVVNIQGDEPFIDFKQIEKLTACFSNIETQIASLAKVINDLEEINSPNVVKLVIDKNNKALYFSRFPIPYLRDKSVELNRTNYLKHIGIYAYRSNVLNALCNLETSNLERAESLEQLRWLENGYQIYINFTDSESIAVDTPEDLERAERFAVSIEKN